MTEATKAEEVELIRWGPEKEKAFQAMKGALASASALGLPDYSRPFELFVHANKGAASGARVQKLGPRCRSSFACLPQGREQFQRDSGDSSSDCRGKKQTVSPASSNNRV